MLAGHNSQKVKVESQKSNDLLPCECCEFICSMEKIRSEIVGRA